MEQNIFDFRDELLRNYADYSSSFTKIKSKDLKAHLTEKENSFRPEPMIQINPHYEVEKNVSELVDDGVLHSECEKIFLNSRGESMKLYWHQQEAIMRAAEKKSYVLTTGTGSGKSLSFFIPIIDSVLRCPCDGGQKRTRAIIIYPMNALANSQMDELKKYQKNSDKFTFAIYTGQESATEKKYVADNPPDILLTNYMMLELLLTRYEENDRKVMDNCKGLEFLVLDELHTYRGRQGADVALLIRRLRDRLDARNVICVGTSATMTNVGSRESQEEAVKQVASKLFGCEADSVITERLCRVTEDGKDSIIPLLKNRVFDIPSNFDEFKKSPLAVWTELTLGVELPGDGTSPKRATPLSLSEAAKKLAADAGIDEDAAKKTLKTFLIESHKIKMPDGKTPFAFKLHQFISAPGKLFATLEKANERKITLDAQVYADQENNVRLFGTHFCRSCGHEYHPVNFDGNKFSPRDIEDTSPDDESESKFPVGYLSPMDNEGEHPFSEITDLPDTWLEEGKNGLLKVKSHYKKFQPHGYHIEPDGTFLEKETDDKKFNFWFIPGKFRFCVSCGTLFEPYGRDINRLASLSGEGRSSATTMITLQILFQLYKEKPEIRKLLGFIDNRQDAALQAGHFNDFIFLITFRAALLAAIGECGGRAQALDLPEKILEAIGAYHDDMRREFFLNDKLTGEGLRDARDALRFTLGYRMIRDLRRGWRNNNPNLEQLGMLEIDFNGLEEFCADDKNFPADIPAKSPVERLELARHILRDLCSNICISSRWLSQSEFEKAQGKTINYLRAWGLGQDERAEPAKFFILGPAPKDDKKNNDFISGSSRSRFMKNLKRSEVWKKLKCLDSSAEELIQSVVPALQNGGYLVEQKNQNLQCWQVADNQIVWKLKDISRGNGVNQFFLTLYKKIAQYMKDKNRDLFGFESQEHTGQVDSEMRKKLECRFRNDEDEKKKWLENNPGVSFLKPLPVLYCSPTMELGVDISALNFVYMRNVPPTPANYAQRSGRAGRSGQPALAMTYCAAQSPHDQWFFEHSDEMVQGIVKAPTLDFANDELLKSHIHAVWLAEVRQKLSNGIKPLIDVGLPTKPLKEEILSAINDKEALERARVKAHRLIESVRQTSEKMPDWCNSGYVDGIINHAPAEFDKAFNRWRDILKATEEQRDLANKKNSDYSVSEKERDAAKRRYNEALNQIKVLLKEDSTFNSDFYTYRYLAGQNFLPGYNFPRLPLMAWIPQRDDGGKDKSATVVSRSRFLAISEFGPRSLIYHSGRTYRVVRLKLQATSPDQVSAGSSLNTISRAICALCGYMNESSVDICEHCGARLEESNKLDRLYRAETVETKLEERITVNDEERRHEGFELQTSFKFMPASDGVENRRTVDVRSGGTVIAEMTYSPAATIYKINKGLRRRKNKNVFGFYIDPISGWWSKKGTDEENNDATTQKESSEEKNATDRIVPFVEDSRNILIFTPKGLELDGDQKRVTTLKAALLRGLEQYFQLNSSEIDAVLLPNAVGANCILFYEAAEGGVGVLSQIAENNEVFKNIIREALTIMHWENLENLEQLLKSDKKIDCRAGCYHCLLSYYNQTEHERIDRRDAEVLSYLLELLNEGEFLGKNEFSSKNCRKNVPLLGGALTADEMYQGTRTAVFYNPISIAHQDMLFEQGINVKIEKRD